MITPNLHDPDYWYSDEFLDYTDGELAIAYCEFIETDQAMTELIHESTRRGLTLNDLEQIFLEINECSATPIDCTSDTDDCDIVHCCGTTA